MLSTFNQKLWLLSFLLGYLLLGPISHARAKARVSNVILETPRTLIRTLQPQDATELSQIFHHPDVLALCKSEKNEEKIIEWVSYGPLRRPDLFWDKKLNFAILLKENQKLIGMVQLVRIRRRALTYGLEIPLPTENQVAKAGYFLAPQFWNQGLMTEVLIEVRDFALNELNIQNIVAETTPENIASQRVMIKAGFKQIGEGKTPLGQKRLYFRIRDPWKI